jgi:FtsZ-interacting cell division protein YlmF
LKKKHDEIDDLAGETQMLFLGLVDSDSDNRKKPRHIKQKEKEKNGKDEEKYQESSRSVKKHGSKKKIRPISESTENENIPVKIDKKTKKLTIDFSDNNAYEETPKKSDKSKKRKIIFEDDTKISDND